MDAQHVINVDTTDALQMGPVDDGEYKVQILNAEYKEGEGSRGPWKGISLMLDIPDEHSADIFNHMQWIPHDGQEGKDFEKTKSRFNDFKLALGLAPAEQFSVDDLIGREGWAYVIQKEDEEYGVQNKIRKWISGPGGGEVRDY